MTDTAVQDQPQPFTSFEPGTHAPRDADELLEEDRPRQVVRLGRVAEAMGEHEVPGVVVPHELAGDVVVDVAVVRPDGLSAVEAPALLVAAEDRREGRNRGPLVAAGKVKLADVVGESSRLALYPERRLQQVPPGT